MNCTIEFPQLPANSLIMEFSPSPSRSSLYKQKKPHSANALDRYCLLLFKKSKETLHLISIISIKMEMVSKKITCVALLCMLVIAVAPGAEALTCGSVVAALTPCIGYLQGGSLAASCCGGIKSLVSQAKTPADRRTACNCLKSAAGSIKNIDYGKAAGLPGKCGVNIPYKISPSTNCNSVN